jgi:hypothetical protein
MPQFSAAAWSSDVMYVMAMSEGRTTLDSFSFEGFV